MEMTAEDLPDGVHTIALTGRMDSAGTQEIDLRFSALTSTRPGLVVVDMARVTFLASIGIRTLMTNAKALSLRGGRMAIAAPQPLVRSVLTLANIHLLIPIFDDVSSACASVKAPVESV